MPIPTELFTTIMEHFAPDSASDAAGTAVRAWHALFHKLAPLLGPLSADLLFARSLTVQEAQFPWLPKLAPSAARTAFADFERSLANRPAEEIAAVNRALLSTYTTVLAGLIGDGLATRVLGGAFPDVATTRKTEE
jgi:hypothetical protein